MKVERHWSNAVAAPTGVLDLHEIGKAFALPSPSRSAEARMRGKVAARKGVRSARQTCQKH
jgi:hypothetical protein